MTVNRGLVITGKDPRAADVIRVRVRVDDGANRRCQQSSECGPDRARIDDVRRRIDDDRPIVSLDQDDVARRIPDCNVNTLGDPNYFLAEFVRMGAQLFPAGKILGKGRRCGEDREQETDE
jgi:hypothetical protein